MSEETIAETEETVTEAVETAAEPVAEAPAPEEITYHAVEKEGVVTAIWEMQGRKHLKTIDPRSRMGQQILQLYTADHHEDIPADAVNEAAAA
jgi:hypothetical protein